MIVRWHASAPRLSCACQRRVTARWVLSQVGALFDLNTVITCYCMLVTWAAARTGSHAAGPCRISSTYSRAAATASGHQGPRAGRGLPQTSPLRFPGGPVMRRVPVVNVAPSVSTASESPIDSEESDSMRVTVTLAQCHGHWHFQLKHSYASASCALR